MSRHASLDPTWSNGANLTAESLGLVEDSEMRFEADQAMTWGTEYASHSRYLTIDTNVLINHRLVVQALHDLLKTLNPSPLLLLIPSVVINELDRLAKSAAQSDGRNVAGSASVATLWLLSVNRLHRERGHGVLRCQRWVERLHTELKKADDRILDCCLFFAPKSQGVTLWTDDRNLSLLAETNDIPTIGGRTITLERILKASCANLPEEVWSKLPQIQAKLRTSHHKGDDGEMELDEEWVRPGDGDGEMMIDETGTKASPPSTIASLPVTPSTSTILLPTRKIPPSLVTSFQSTFTPIATSLTTSAIPISSESTAPDLVKSVVSSLSNLETATARASDERKSLLRAIGAGRTILSFVQDDKKTRRPRTGEVADALELLGDVLSELEILDCIADLYELAEKVRELP